MAPDIAALNGGQTELGEQAVADLTGQLDGKVLTPEDPGYAEIREPFNAMQPSRPALVVRCSATGDVVAAVNFARNHAKRKQPSRDGASRTTFEPRVC